MKVRRPNAAAGAVLAATLAAGLPAQASPAPPNLTVDKTFGKVAGWSIGYSDSLGGCLAAATYGDGTTLWFGIGGVRGSSYLALTNPKWRSIQSGGQYELRLLAAGQGRWRGTFTGFERGDSRGLFQSGLKERFVADLSNAGAIGVIFEGRQIATLSLVGSTEAFDAVVGCQKEAITAAAKAGGSAVASSGGASPDRAEDRAGERSSQGTGFYVSEKGHVMTNHHVIDGCGSITVAQVGAAPLKARLVASDARNDLAVLATDRPAADVPPITVRARVGEAVFAYGFPLNGILATSGNFTMGNVTATAGLGDDTSRLQVSVPIQPGNSGGPLVDQYGNVVGIIVSKLNALKMASITADVAQNVNFAIKTTTALSFLEANGIEAPIGVKGGTPMDGETIAEKAKAFTVRVNCR